MILAYCILIVAAPACVGAAIGIARGYLSGEFNHHEEES